MLSLLSPLKHSRLRSLLGLQRAATTAAQPGFRQLSQGEQRHLRKERRRASRRVAAWHTHGNAARWVRWMPMQVSSTSCCMSVHACRSSAPVIPAGPLSPQCSTLLPVLPASLDNRRACPARPLAPLHPPLAAALFFLGVLPGSFAFLLAAAAGRLRWAGACVLCRLSVCPSRPPVAKERTAPRASCELLPAGQAPLLAMQQHLHTTWSCLLPWPRCSPAEVVLGACCACWAVTTAAWLCGGQPLAVKHELARCAGAARLVAAMRTPADDHP